MADEGFVLDGLDVNAGVYTATALKLTPAKERPEWAEGTDSDGALLVRDPHYTNSQWDATIEVWAATRDAGQAAVGLIVDKLREAKQNPGGIPLVWTPASSTDTLTFYVLTGEVEEIPITIESGYFASPPVLAVSLTLTCAPFGYEPEVGDLTDNFSTNTIALYTFDAGGGTLSVSGGQLVPSTTAAKQFFRNDRKFYDFEETIKVTTGASVATYRVDLGKRLDVNNQILFIYTNSSGLTIRKFDAGVLTLLASGEAAALVAATNYWFRFRIEGNKVTAERWTAAPTPGGTPAASATFTLTAGDATKFGLGANGDAYLRLDPPATDWRMDDFSVSPNTYVEKTLPMLVTPPIYGFTGDVLAEGRVIATDIAGQSRDFAAWGLESRYQAQADIILTQPDLTATGFSGTSTTRAGSISTNIYRGTLATGAVAVCGTGNQPHVGTYRVYAGLWATGLGVRVRLSSREGDGPLTALEWETPPVEDAWVELDLGLVTISSKVLGTQRWQGQVEAYSDVVGDTLDVDYLLLVPAGEGFGRARFDTSQRLKAHEVPTAYIGRDEFDQVAGALAGKTAPVGGVWVGAGSASGDFTVNASTHTAQRTNTTEAGGVHNGRYAISGASAVTRQVAQVEFKTSDPNSSASDHYHGVVVRYTDINNWAKITLHTISNNIQRLFFYKNVATVITQVSSIYLTSATGAGVGIVADVWYKLLLSVDEDGGWYAALSPLGLNPSPMVELSGNDSVLATGGALATGKPGFYDYFGGGVATTRDYDNFAAWVPAANAVCFASQSIEFRSDDTLREDSTGVYYGRPQEYRGASVFIPPAGDENRPSRVAAMLRRNDIYTTAVAGQADGVQLQVLHTPRRLYLPR